MTAAAAAMICLALNVYHEARGETTVGQAYVAQVTMNRADDDPSKVCKVVYAPNQFSWTRNKKLRRKLPGRTEFAWVKAKAIAKVALSGGYKGVVKGATFYHSKSVSPEWADDMKLVAAVGNHIFYARQP